MSRLYAAIEALPEGVTGELIRGQLYTQPRPAGRHALVVSNLGADLVNPYGRGRGGPGGWWILIEPEVHFVRDVEVAVPDVAGWKRDRMPHVPDDQRFEVAPDWICEVLSPSTASRDREVKMPLYGQYGVPFLWLVDPLDRRLEAYVLDAGEWRLQAAFEEDQRIVAPPFEEITLDPPWS
jgi:Uma2 family endonuclease